MYSGVSTNVPAFEQPATVSWLRYLLIVKGCGGGVPRAGWCAAAPTAAVTTSEANATTWFNSFMELSFSVFETVRSSATCRWSPLNAAFGSAVLHGYERAPCTDGIIAPYTVKSSER